LCTNLSGQNYFEDISDNGELKENVGTLAEKLKMNIQLGMGHFYTAGSILAFVKTQPQIEYNHFIAQSNIQPSTAYLCLRIFKIFKNRDITPFLGLSRRALAALTSCNISDEVFNEVEQELKKGQVTYPRIKFIIAQSECRYEKIEKFEYLTSEDIMKLVKNVLGEINTDPFSSPEGNVIVNAKIFYTETEDTFGADWNGSCWISPPRDCQKKCAQKLFVEVLSNHCTSFVFLAKVNTDRKYFQRLLKSFPVCFVQGHLQFIKHEKLTNTVSKSACFLSPSFFLLRKL